MFFVQFSVPGNLVCDFATIPNDILNGDKYYTFLSSMFMHGGWLHLIGNMLFLWVFADNIEAVIGNVNFIVYYLRKMFTFVIYCSYWAIKMLKVGIYIQFGLTRSIYGL